MKKYIFQTNNNFTGLLLRISIATVLWPHGAQKLLGLFGGFGFQGTMSFFTDTLQLPWLIGITIIAIEFFGSISLILGFASRIWSALIIILMIGIILTSHMDHGFFMNWFGNQKGEGYEYHLLMIGLSIATLTEGSGKYSFDSLIARKYSAKNT